jgi:hypothetical protein
MARLKFVPRAGILVPYPGRGPGDIPHAGRKIVVDEVSKSISAPVHEDGIDVLEGTAEADRFIQLCRRDGDVHPADEYTARTCGVPFVPLRQREDGEWEPGQSAPARPSRAPAPPAQKGDG